MMFRNFLSRIFVFVFISTSLTTPAISFASSVLENPLAMTLSTVAIAPAKDSAKEELLTVLPGRSNVPLMDKKWGKVGFTYQLQSKKNAPLVFLIPGTGGSYKSTTSGYIAEKLFAQGYHTITIDNAFNWKFVVGGSTSAIPGYISEDAKDLYQVLKKIKNYLKVGHGVNPSGHSLIGYSMGGLHSLFIKRMDDELKEFSFERVLLINPPVNLFHGVQALDQLYLKGETLGKQGQTNAFNRLLDVGETIFAKSNADLKSLNLEEVVDALDFSDADYAYLISFTFRLSLHDVIFASQQVKDLGIFKNKATKYKRNARMHEISQFSFKDYMKRFVLPLAQQKMGAEYTSEDLNRDSSLYQFENMIKNDPRVFLVHSQDDFLLAQGDAQWLSQTFGSRAVIFPYGGHCGNIAFPQFAEFLNFIF